MARISTSQRELKRLNLLEVATKLLETNNYHDITLDMIARAGSMTKSNLYHYFGSKEELYQTIFLMHMDRVSSAIETELVAYNGSDDFEAVVDILVKNLDLEPCMHDVGMLITTTLTRNITDDEVLNYQKHFNNAGLKLTKSLLMALPSLNVFQIEAFIDYLLALKNGIWGEYSASEKYQEIIKESLRSQTDQTFATRLKGGLLLLLKGLYAENQE